jgi:SAM-dependent methyltransferase
MPSDRMLDLGGVGKGGPGFTNVNLMKPCDVLHDLDDFPYPFEDGSIDRIQCIHTLEHLFDPLKVMGEMWRICRNGAIIFIQVPHHSQDEQADPWHVQGFRKEWFVKLCGGFSGVMKSSDAYWRPFSFKLIGAYHTTGTFRRWKKYSLNVVLEVVKGTE